MHLIGVYLTGVHLIPQAYLLQARRSPLRKPSPIQPAADPQAVNSHIRIAADSSNFQQIPGEAHTSSQFGDGIATCVPVVAFQGNEQRLVNKKSCQAFVC